MRRTWLSFLGIFIFATAAEAQIGRTPTVAAGTPEDKAVSEIYAAQDPAQKIALLDKFSAQFRKGDLALLADQLYVSAYLAEKNYAKVFEYGDKALALDPDNFSTVVSLVRAAAEAGDTEKLFHYGEVAAGILARYKTAPAPAGTSADQWAQQKAETLQSALPDIQYIQYAMYAAGFKTADPASKVALFERFVTIFPDSSFTKNAEEETAFAYQQAQQYPKMLDAAQKVMKDDPNNVGMLLLLADYWSERGQNLKLAGADAQQALDLLGTATKPANVTDAQWQQQVSLQKGLGLSALGQVNVYNGRNLAAIKAFEEASPLLKSNSATYARNLYRWGFTLAKMRRTMEARRILTEAVSIQSPYRPLAEQTLNRIGGPLTATTRRRH